MDNIDNTNSGGSVSETVISLDKVSLFYGSKTAVDTVSYEVKRGSVCALLGENGAGKTSTIKMLLGFLEPDSGSIEVLGMNPRRNRFKLGAMTGYVPEQPVLYDWMTVREIGEFSSAFYQKKKYWDEYERMIHAYEIPLTVKIKTLSKGMKALVSLSLALAHDPELLVLDEPTSGLDPLVRRTILENMVDRAARGKTVFLSSHQIAEVERVADTVTFMKKSRLVLTDSVDHLKESCLSLILSFETEISQTLQNETLLLSLFEEPLETEYQGRTVRILGRSLRHDLLENLSRSEMKPIAREIIAPTLEEIFIGYMKKANHLFPSSLKEK